MFYDGRMSSECSIIAFLSFSTTRSSAIHFTFSLFCFSEDPSLEVVYRFYWLCYHIHTYKKTQVPSSLTSYALEEAVNAYKKTHSTYYYWSYQVALVHGISMGGGASLMIPMKFSVVTEKTVRTINLSFRLYFWITGFDVNYVE